MVLPGIYPFPRSPDLGRLVQDRLKIVNQQFSALAPDTLDDFRIVADELLTIARICQTTINRLAAQTETYNAVEAFKDTERALDWAECMDLTKNVTSSTDCSSPSCGQGRPSTFSTHPSLPRARPACYGRVRSVYICCSEDTVQRQLSAAKVCARIPQVSWDASGEGNRRT
jgi:hypothetical protein